MSQQEKKSYNVKISSRAWEILRWAKAELNAKSYSDTIIDMEKRLSKISQKEILQTFDDEKHSIKAKIPGKSTDTKPKTILLTPEARKVLLRLKAKSNEYRFTFSDGIEFLSTKNKFLPDHLKKK